MFPTSVWSEASEKSEYIDEFSSYVCICCLPIWEKGKIIEKEKIWTQRKYLEGIESSRRKNQGIEPLNNYNQLEQWQPVLFPLFERQNLYMSSSDGMCK